MFSQSEKMIEDKFREKYEEEKCKPELRTITYCAKYYEKDCPRTCDYAQGLEKGEGDPYFDSLL